MERVSYLCLSVLEDLVSKIWNLILSEMPVIRTKNKVWTSNPHSVGFSFCYVICLGRFTWQYNSRQLKYKCAPVKWLGCCRNWVRKKLDFFFFFWWRSSWRRSLLPRAEETFNFSALVKILALKAKSTGYLTIHSIPALRNTSCYNSFVKSFCGCLHT